MLNFELKLTSVPKRINLEAALFELEKGVKSFVDRKLRRDFNLTIRTWRRKPKFITTMRRGSGKITGRIETSNKIYKFVSGGTRVRYATMTSDFSSKTQSNFLGSRGGRGGVMIVSRARPRPGIKARKFDVLIYRKNKRKFSSHMRPYIIRALRR